MQDFFHYGNLASGVAAAVVILMLVGGSLALGYGFGRMLFNMTAEDDQ